MTRRNHISLMPSLHKRLGHAGPSESLSASGMGVVLSYTGLVDGDMIPHLVQLAERALAHESRTRKEVKRAMAVLIESVQNVIHHGHIDEHGESSLYLTLENTPLGYQLHCGNLMDEERASMLSQRIGDLNNLSHAELRKLYVEVLCTGQQHPQFGNAGLGLISIAKRAQGPIEFLSQDHDCGLQLVTLTVTIKR